MIVDAAGDDDGEGGPAGGGGDARGDNDCGHVQR